MARIRPYWPGFRHERNWMGLIGTNWSQLASIGPIFHIFSSSSDFPQLQGTVKTKMGNSFINNQGWEKFISSVSNNYCTIFEYLIIQMNIQNNHFHLLKICFKWIWERLIIYTHRMFLKNLDYNMQCGWARWWNIRWYAHWGFGYKVFIF